MGLIQIVESVITCSFSHGRKREDVFGIGLCNTALQLSPAQLKFLPKFRSTDLPKKVIFVCSAIIGSPQSKLLSNSLLKVVGLSTTCNYWAGSIMPPN